MFTRICPFFNFFIIAMTIPAIIVQGGGFAVIANHDIYKNETAKAASEGYRPSATRQKAPTKQVSLHPRGE